MVFTKVILVRGVKLDRDQFFTFIAKLKEWMGNQTKHYRFCKDTDYDDEWFWEYRRELNDFLSRFRGLKGVYTYKCCSELSGKVFIIGKITKNITDIPLDAENVRVTRQM